jgi:hypothetical protein
MSGAATGKPRDPESVLLVVATAKLDPVAAKQCNAL